MASHTFRADWRQSVLFFLVFLGLAVIAFWIAASDWGGAIGGGLALFFAMSFTLAVVILGYRLVARPVMIRIDAEGIFMKRLAVTIPWDAIGAIRTVEAAGGQLLSIVETDAGHPVFDERALLLGAALNAKAGLPALAISPAGLKGDTEDLIRAIESASSLTVERPAN